MPEPEYGFGILNEAQALDVAKNIRINHCCCLGITKDGKLTFC